MDVIVEWFRWLNDAHQINFTIIYDEYDRGRYLSGLQATLFLSVVTILFSIVIGLFGAWAQGARLAPLRWLVYGYIQFFRNTPPLAQVYFFYFGLGAMSFMPTVTNKFGVAEPLLGSYSWAVISLSFFAGAFNVEIFRSGVEAVPATTVEAARSLGYTRLQTYIYVVLPLAFRICLPALNNNLVNLVKTTALAYAIAVPELLYISNQIWADEFNVPEMMNVLLFTFVVLVGVLVWIMHRWERAMRIPGYTA